MAESSRSVDVEESKNDSLDEENNGITMLDVLEEQQDLEADVKAVLGGSDDKNCTYSRGYMKRQALYACATCIPRSESSKPAGICLACSYHCHEGHELVELYTKRNFRCDCGNSKFPSNKCNLEPNKSPVNDQNQYNQNFSGVYCTCKRPYPDPEEDIADDMIQCALCEDWFHMRHLGNPVPPHEFGDMICMQCMSQHKFLQLYKGYALTKVVSEDAKDIKIEDEDLKKETLGNNAIEENACLLKKLKAPEGEPTTVYFPETIWRKYLCTCNSCKQMYETEGVSFLLDEQDTMRAYEDKGKRNGNGSHFESQYERGMKALQSLDRVQQVEAISEYNKMKSHLKEYLQKFVESKKVVREEDIREFFSGMEARKRQRVDMPYYCH